jgi:hypothetical protein
MSLNKEMIFGLSFGGDNMKMLVISSYKSKTYYSTLSAKSFVTSTPICLTLITGLSSSDTVTIKYPDNSTLVIEEEEIGTSGALGVHVYLPEGTTLTAPRGGVIMHYLSCKWVDV